MKDSVNFHMEKVHFMRQKWAAAVISNGMKKISEVQKKERLKKEQEEKERKRKEEEEKQKKKLEEQKIKDQDQPRMVSFLQKSFEIWVLRRSVYLSSACQYDSSV